jgi:hypothetical protein
MVFSSTEHSGWGICNTEGHGRDYPPFDAMHTTGGDA